jgi:hypothetical protein
MTCRASSESRRFTACGFRSSVVISASMADANESSEEQESRSIVNWKLINNLYGTYVVSGGVDYSVATSEVVNNNVD